MSKFIRRLIAFLTSAALFIVLLEVGLRLLPQAIPLQLLEQFTPGIRNAVARRRSLQTAEDTIVLPRDDGGPPARMWIYRPFAEVTFDFAEPGIVKTVRMDARGFCNPAADAYDVPRIDVAALGDSFTWCTTVAPADTWPSQLAQLTGLRTYDFGIPGRGLYEHLQILKQFALAKSPVIVVLNVYEGNDLRDAALFREWRAADASAHTSAACPFESTAACRRYDAFGYSLIGRRSYAANLAASALHRRAYSRRRREINFEYQVEAGDGREVVFNSRNGDRDEVLFARRLRDGEISLDLFDDALEEFVGLARANRFIPIVAYTPSAYSAFGTRTRFTDPDIEHLLRTYSERQRRYFARQGAALGYHFIDMTPPLIAATATLDSDHLAYFRTNVHLTPTGHTVIARELATMIGMLRRRNPTVSEALSPN
jgi:hypothetical protein